eukprot:4355644-Amphidinium_carterae.2
MSPHPSCSRLQSRLEVAAQEEARARALSQELSTQCAGWKSEWEESLQSLRDKDSAERSRAHATLDSVELYGLPAQDLRLAFLSRVPGSCVRKLESTWRRPYPLHWDGMHNRRDKRGIEAPIRVMTWRVNQASWLVHSLVYLVSPRHSRLQSSLSQALGAHRVWIAEGVQGFHAVSYTHLRAHETEADL